MAEKCVHCGGYHESTCPRIKAIDYYPDGTVKRVEYREPQPISGCGATPAVAFAFGRPEQKPR